MHTESTITMHAPMERTFEVAADLSRWPAMLPHYRYIRYLEQSPERNVVLMAARRGWLPIRWTSEQIINRPKHEVRFRHLKAFTKGMLVVWTFAPRQDGVEVRISHDLSPAIPIIGGLVAWTIGTFFITPVARRTLKHMKIYVESRNA